MAIKKSQSIRRAIREQLTGGQREPSVRRVVAWRDALREAASSKRAMPRHFDVAQAVAEGAVDPVELLELAERQKSIGCPQMALRLRLLISLIRTLADSHGKKGAAGREGRPIAAEGEAAAAAVGEGPADSAISPQLQRTDKKKPSRSTKGRNRRD